MRRQRQELTLGTWLDPEELCYPKGGMTRKARAYNVNTGMLQTVACGIPDTAFTIPAQQGGYISMSNSGIALFHPKRQA